jgi:hypothetical protein
MSYITLKGHWCDVIVLNVHAPTEDKDDVIKDSFYKELEPVFHQFCRCCMKTLLGDLNTKVGREDIFNSVVGNTTFPHHDIHKHTWTSPDDVTHRQIMSYR